MSSFRNAASIEELADGKRKVIDIDDHEVLLLLDGETPYAISNVCTCISAVVGHPRPSDSSDPHTHGGRLERLQEAEIADGRISCPRHHSVYDLASGKPLSGSAEVPLNTYEVRLSGDDVEVAEMTDAERHFYNDEGEADRP